MLLLLLLLVLLERIFRLGNNDESVLLIEDVQLDNIYYLLLCAKQNRNVDDNKLLK